MTEPMVAFVQGQLSAQADAERAEQMANYMKTSMPFYGVPAPKCKEVLRQLRKAYPVDGPQSLEAQIDALWALPHREEKYIAISLAKASKKHIDWSLLPCFEAMIREGQWWDFVDPLATHMIGHLIELEPERGLALMDEWIMDEDMWIRRTVLISQLRRKTQTDAERLFSYCALRMDEKAFFIRKAIGWALREYSKVAPEAVFAFLQEHAHHLSGLSYREGAKHLKKQGYEV